MSLRQVKKLNKPKEKYKIIRKSTHRGQTALDFDLEGTPRGNCTGWENLIFWFAILIFWVKWVGALELLTSSMTYHDYWIGSWIFSFLNKNALFPNRLEDDAQDNLDKVNRALTGVKVEKHNWPAISEGLVLSRKYSGPGSSWKWLLFRYNLVREGWQVAFHFHISKYNPGFWQLRIKL